jgi:hypothetical protein
MFSELPDLRGLSRAQLMGSIDLSLHLFDIGLIGEFELRNLLLIGVNLLLGSQGLLILDQGGLKRLVEIIIVCLFDLHQ